MIQSFLDVIGVLLCMVITFVVTFLLGILGSYKSHRASHFFGTAWLTSCAGFGGALFAILKLI